MSLFTQSPTQIQPILPDRPHKGRKKNVDFSLDFMSFWTIIMIMKGRICYADFSEHPGIEKLYSHYPCQASFLMPVTPVLSVGWPFHLGKVAGLDLLRIITVTSIEPATRFFCSLFSCRGGWSPIQSPPIVESRFPSHFRFPLLFF